VSLLVLVLLLLLLIWSTLIQAMSGNRQSRQASSHRRKVSKKIFSSVILDVFLRFNNKVVVEILVYTC
jgi:hypothetical protein